MKAVNLFPVKIRFQVRKWVLLELNRRNEALKAHISVTDQNRLADAIRADRLDSLTQRVNGYCFSDTINIDALEQSLNHFILDSVRLIYELERTVRIAEKQRRKIAMPPGRWIGWFARTFLTLKTQSRVIEPLIADYRYEAYQAISKGDAFREYYLRVLYGSKFLQITIGKAFAAIIRIFMDWY